MASESAPSPFTTLGIVGTGAMGRGIAQLAAQAGLNVMLFDVKKGAVEEAQHFIKGLWQRSAEKQRISQAQVQQYSERLAEASELTALAPCDIVVEAIVEKLEAEGKVPDGDARPVRLGACVLFIDEVHALPPMVANILLSALDDARLTTIDNIDYDFGEVVFLMATTDAGKLTEAFRSRPDRVLLRNYTLDELAGILWLHGQGELDGYSLPRDVCLEIAARTRALPRVAVRMLANQLIPHFYAAVRGAGGSPSRHLIGEAMTVETVAAYFDSQGVDANGLDATARNYLSYLSTHGATAEERLRQGLGISNRGDFVEVDEYLQRLGLVTVRGGRTLTREGRRYLQASSDLRHRISRQQ